MPISAQFKSLPPGGVNQVYFSWCKSSHCLELSIYATVEPSGICEELRVNRAGKIADLTVKGSRACSAEVGNTSSVGESLNVVAWAEHSLLFVLNDIPGRLTIDQLIAAAKEPTIRLPK